VPKYDFRCTTCGHLFELTRSFSQSAEPAACPHDGTSATRLFSPSLDLLMYRRQPVIDTRPVTIPAGALSCHDHGPPPSVDGDGDGHRSGSHWHAHGYEGSAEEHAHQGHNPGHGHTHGHGHGHSHAHGHGHTHGHGHAHRH
jgi:putative FmdB family regulatory protein